MSKQGEVLYHPVNGTTEETWEGFSWPGLLCGAVWLAVKQLWAHFAISLLVIVVTAGFGSLAVWIYCGFAGNSTHKKSLLRKGYLTKEQYSQKKSAELNMASPATATASIGVADELSKLAELHKAGILTDIEFANRKRRLLEA